MIVFKNVRFVGLRRVVADFNARAGAKAPGHIAVFFAYAVVNFSVDGVAVLDVGFVSRSGFRPPTIV